MMIAACQADLVRHPVQGARKLSVKVVAPDDTAPANLLLSMANKFDEPMEKFGISTGKVNL